MIEKYKSKSTLPSTHSLLEGIEAGWEVLPAHPPPPREWEVLLPLPCIFFS